MTSQKRSLDIGIPSVPQLIQSAITEFTKEDLYIGIPVKVTDVSEYESKQVVSVQPLINDTYKDGITLTAPTLRSIFVKLPSGGGFAIKLPIAVGDLATLHYSHRDISTFLDGTGSPVNNPIERSIDIKDCWVTHGFGTRSNHQNPSVTDLIIKGPNTTITITPDGILTAETSGQSTIKSSKHIIDAPETEITGTLKVIGDVTNLANVATTGTTTSGVIEASTSLKINNVEVKDHVHGGVTSGGSNTAPLQ